MKNLPELAAFGSLKTRASKLEAYREVIKKEFPREFLFLVGVALGHNKAKGDFTDDLVKVMTLSLDIIGNFTPAGYNIIPVVAGKVIDFANDQRKDGDFDHIGYLFDGVDPVALLVLTEQVAELAAHRYCRFIDNTLSENPVTGVIPFARAGVQRMLEYIARRNVPLSIPTLLQGLVEGRSGKYISNIIKNTNLEIKVHTDISYTAEGAYGRPPYSTQQNSLNWNYWILANKEERLAKQEKRPEMSVDELKKLWEEAKKDYELKPTDTKKRKTKKVIAKLLVNTKDIAVWLNDLRKEQWDHFKNIHSHYGYTKLNKDNNNPKYDFVDVPPEHVEHYYGKNCKPAFAKPMTTNPNECPQICRVTSDDVKSYMENNVQGQPKPKIFFREYIKNVYNYPKDYSADDIAIYVSDVSTVTNKSLANGDFSGVYFLQADLKGFTLNGGNFNNARFWFSDLTDAKAIGCDFYAASLQNAIAKKCDFSNSILTHTRFEFADLSGATLSHLNEGAQWYGAKLEGIQTDIKNAIERLQQEQKEEKKAYIKELTAIKEDIAELKKLTTYFDSCVTNQLEVNEKFLLEFAKIKQQQQDYEAFKRYLEGVISSIQRQLKDNNNQLEEKQQQLGKQVSALEEVLNKEVNTLTGSFLSFMDNYKSELNQVMVQVTQLETRLKQMEEKMKEEEKLKKEPAKPKTTMALASGRSKIKNIEGLKITRIDTHISGATAKDVDEMAKTAQEYKSDRDFEMALTTDQAEIEKIANSTLDEIRLKLEQTNKMTQTQGEKPKEEKKLQTNPYQMWRSSEEPQQPESRSEYVENTKMEEDPERPWSGAKGLG